MNKKVLLWIIIVVAIFIGLVLFNSPEVNKDNAPAIYGEYTKIKDIRNTEETFKARHSNGHWYWISVVKEGGQTLIIPPVHADDCPKK